MAGKVLIDAKRLGLESTQEERQQKPEAIERAMGRRNSFRGSGSNQPWNYVETNHMFAYSWWDVALQNFDLCHYDVRVVVLRRYLPDVVESQMRLNFSALRKLWYYTLGDKTAVLAKPCEQHPSEVESLLGYLYDVEAHVDFISQRFPGVPMVSVRLAELQSEENVNKLYDHLGLKLKDETCLNRVAGVPYNQKKSHGYKAPGADSAKEAKWATAADAFEADCAAAGVKLPMMPQKHRWVEGVGDGSDAGRRLAEKRDSDISDGDNEKLLQASASVSLRVF